MNCKPSLHVERLGLLEIERTFGISQLELGEGTCQASQWLPDGRSDVSVGWLGPLIDFAIGRAAETLVLPKNLSMRTSAMHVDVVRDINFPGERVFAKSEVVDIDSSTALGSVCITSEEGLTLATATARNILVAAGRYDQAGLPAADAPPATPDLLELLFARTTAPAVIEVPSQDWLANPFGIVHGGVLFTLLQLGVESAVALQTGRAKTLDLSVSLHRPALLGPAPIVVTGEVERVGQRVIVATARLHQHDSAKLIGTARATLLRT